jgi:hypothetical protein
MMTRLEKLKELERILEHSLVTSDIKSMAGIARQYRETIREIEEIESVDESDEISDIINGFSGADGPDRAELPEE